MILSLAVTLESKNKALDTLTRDVAGLRRSLDDVTGMEESLRQANETLREKVTVIESLEQEGAHKDDVIRQLTCKNEELEKTLDVTSRDESVDDVSDMSRWQEKFEAKCGELVKIEAELAAARECERSAKAASSSSVSKAAKEMDNEKERHVAEANELRAALAQRTAGLQRAQAELVRVRSNLETEHKKQTELRQKVSG